jgi:putative spermidine/putrescine transport system ATP-binding protein
MQFEIKHIHEQLGVTVVYVTHDQGEALTMSDRVAVFNDGRIQQLAPPEELYERPLNSFVAQFIGENNTLKGTIETIEGRTCTVRLASGEVIDALPVNVTRPGEPTLVSIRPERVEFQPDRLPAGAHTISAEVLEFIYMGDIFRTRLRVAGNDDFVVKTRNAAGQVKLSPGERLNIGWLPEDCRALETA